MVMWQQQQKLEKKINWSPYLDNRDFTIIIIIIK
jgi:hypothetical protein